MSNNKNKPSLGPAFAEIIRATLKHNGLTQADLAHRLGVSTSSVYAVLTGNPTLSTIERWGRALGIRLLWDYRVCEAPNCQRCCQYIGQSKGTNCGW